MRSKPCGAANEMRQRLAGLNDELRRAYGVELEMRVGINTGQVVAGRAEAGTFATGDAVNLGKRIQQAAEPDEILLGAETYRLVRDAVDAVPLKSRAFKGKTDPVRRARSLREAKECRAPRSRALLSHRADLYPLILRGLLIVPGIPNLLSVMTLGSTTWSCEAC